MNSKFDVAVASLLLGTVIAAAGWIVTYTVDNVVSVPALEYDVHHRTNTDSCDGTKSIVVAIHNLSRKHRFSGIKSVLRLPVATDGEFLSADLKPWPPAYRPREDINRQKKAVDFPETTILPGTGLKLTACYTGLHVPTFHIVEASQAVRPVPKGLSTWLIRNEIWVLVTLFLLWTIVVVVILYKWAMSRRDHVVC